MFVLPGDDDFLQRLEPEKAAALHDIIVYAEPIEKFGQKNRIGDQEGVSFGFFQLPDQQVGAGGDVLPGLRLAGISGLALGGSFPKPLFRRERTIRIREGADTDLVQKRFNMKLTRFENLFSRGAGEKALSDIDVPASRRDSALGGRFRCGPDHSCGRLVKTGGGITPLKRGERFSGTKNQYTHFSTCFYRFLPK